MATGIQLDDVAKTRIRRAILVVFLLGAALIVLLMSDSYAKGVHLRRSGVTVNGVLTGMTSTNPTAGGRDRSGYHATYAYPVGGGRVLTGGQGVTDVRELKVGAPVPVRFDPSNPSVSMLQLGGFDERAFLAATAFFTAIYVTMLGGACLLAARIVAWI